MRSPALSVFFSLLLGASLCGGAPPPNPQRIPAVHKAPEMALDPPVAFPKKAANSARLQDEAEELAELSAGIPARIERVNRGQLPKELNEELKRIEKLAKHLRSEMAQ